MKPFHRTFCAAVLLLLVSGGVLGQTKTESSQAPSIPYLKLIGTQARYARCATMGG